MVVNDSQSGNTLLGRQLRIEPFKDLAEIAETTPWLVPVEDPVRPTPTILWSRNIDEAFYLLVVIPICTPQLRSLAVCETRQETLGHLESPA